MGLFSPGRQFEVLRSHPAFGTMIPIVIISFIFSPVGICLALMGSLKLSRAVLVCLWIGDQVVLGEVLGAGPGQMKYIFCEKLE